MKDINKELMAIADSIRYLADVMKESGEEMVGSTAYLIKIIRWSFMDDFDNNVVSGLGWIAKQIGEEKEKKNENK